MSSVLSQSRDRPLEALDTTIHIVTPENIAFDYRVAGPLRRFQAMMLDYFIRLGIMFALYLVGILISLLLVFLSFYAPFLRTILGQFASITVGLAIVIWFLLDWFYGGIFEAYWNGQTPGKRALGLRVVTTDGRPINGLQAVLRNILRYVDLFPFLSLEILRPFFPAEATIPPVYFMPTLLVGLVSMMLSTRFQRVGDLVCGTMVVMEERYWLAGIAQLEDARVPKLAAIIPADFVVSRTMAKALSMYAERRLRLSPERRQELAKKLAQPLMQRFNLLPDTSGDLLLCALYYRTFVQDQARQTVPAQETTSR